MSIAAIGFQLSLSLPTSWANYHQSLQDYLTNAPILLVLSITALFSLQALVSNSQVRGDRILDLPEWLLPVIIVASSTCIGVMAIHTTRLRGAATLTGLLILLFHSGFEFMFRGSGPFRGALLSILPLLLALDLWYSYHIHRSGRPPSWRSAGIAATVGGLFSLLVVDYIFAYPQIDRSNIISMVLAIGLTALVGCWQGQTVGDYLSTFSRSAQEPAKPPIQMRIIAPSLWIGTLISITWFVITATPPG